jgi:signal transduction histidine kinase
MKPSDPPALAPSPRTDADDVKEAIRTYLGALHTAGQRADGSASEHIALEEIAEIVARERDPERLASDCLKKAASLLDLALARVYRADSRLGEFRLVASHPRPDGAASAGGPALPWSLDQFRIRTDRQKGSVTVDQVAADGAAVGDRAAEYTVLSVPLFDVAGLWGLFQAAAPSQRGFSPSESRTIETIAGLVGLGIGRLEAAEREAALGARIERDRARLAAVRRRLQRVTRDLESKSGALARATDTLEGVERLKDAFVTSISHEMRTPLTIIRSYVDLLLHYEPASRESEVEILKIVDAETTKIIHHVTKILHLTEIRANDVRLHVERQRFEDLARAALEQVGPMLEERRVAVRREIDADLPDLLADREKTIQILVDLLDNAAKFSTAGAEITLGAGKAPLDQSGSRVTVWVADRGIGIAPQDHERIFEQFSQITSVAAGKPRGLGLGLPICRAYVERMGGKVWVESEPGVGSTFFVTLPATRDPAAT